MSLPYIKHPVTKAIVIADDLPTSITYWTASRKALIAAAVTGDVISADEACKRYQVGLLELQDWMSRYKQAGIIGIKAKTSSPSKAVIDPNLNIRVGCVVIGINCLRLYGSDHELNNLLPRIQRKMLWLIAVHSAQHHAVLTKSNLLKQLYIGKEPADAKILYVLKCAINKTLRPIYGSDIILKIWGRGFYIPEACINGD
jgi:hypothetical protein